MAVPLPAADLLQAGETSSPGARSCVRAPQVPSCCPMCRCKADHCRSCGPSAEVTCCLIAGVQTTAARRTQRNNSSSFGLSRRRSSIVSHMPPPRRYLHQDCCTTPCICKSTTSLACHVLGRPAGVVMHCSAVLQVQHSGRARGISSSSASHDIAAAAASGCRGPQQPRRPPQHRGRAVAPVSGLYQRAAALWPQVRADSGQTASVVVLTSSSAVVRSICILDSQRCLLRS